MIDKRRRLRDVIREFLNHLIDPFWGEGRLNLHKPSQEYLDDPEAMAHLRYFRRKVEEAKAKAKEPMTS